MDCKDTIPLSPKHKSQRGRESDDPLEEEEVGAKAQRDELLEEDFICSCCFEILLEPTTLTCGHTFCRFCLANWWSTSKKAECLQCRRPFTEFPSVNFTLRNTLAKLYPERIEEKRSTVSSQTDYLKTLDSFERHVQSDSNIANERRNGNHLNCGTLCIFLSVIIAVIVLITIGMRTLFGGPEVLLDSKIITEWSPDDVAFWVGEQGAWAKGVYDDRFRSAGIDGNLLLKMTEEDLASPPISMHLGLHRRVFIGALNILKLRENDRPDDFWEFKAANRAKSLFLLFGLQQFPRTMILYLYLFDYHDTFLPFFHHTCGSSDAESSNTGTQTWKQWQSFIVWIMTSPYFMIAYYASHFLNVNGWISRIVIIHAFVLGCLELTNAICNFRLGNYRSLPGMMLKNFIYVLGCSLLLKMLWPFVPFFICDIIFYWMFLISPFDALNRLFRSISNFRQAENVGRDPGFNWQFHLRLNGD